MLNNLIRSVAEPAARGEINPPRAAAPPAPRSRCALPGLLAFFYGALNTSFNQLYNFNLAQLLTRMDDKVLKTPQIAGWFNSAIFHGLPALAAKQPPSPAPARLRGCPRGRLRRRRCQSAPRIFPASPLCNYQQGHVPSARRHDSNQWFLSKKHSNNIFFFLVVLRHRKHEDTGRENCNYLRPQRS